MTQQTEIWYISSTEGQRVSVSVYMNFLRNHIQRGALFLFVSVGFTRALFVTKEDITLRFLYKNLSISLAISRQTRQRDGNETATKALFTKKSIQNSQEKGRYYMFLNH